MIVSALGNAKQCYICKKKFRSFGKYLGGSKHLSQFMKGLRVVGSDVDNYECYFCGSNDRERHLFMFFDKLDFWTRLKASRILHFAPEKNLRGKIESLLPVEYIACDLYPKNVSTKQIDATKIPTDDSAFDIIICK